MNPYLKYPKSFPNRAETEFLKLVLSDDAAFPARFERWSREIVLDDVDYATQRLLPLVYLRLTALGLTDVPIFGRLRGIYKLAWVQNQRLLYALDQVAAKFESLGIRMLMLKGVPLLALAYRDVGARFLGDADILIDRRDIKKALSAMTSDQWELHSDFFPNADYFTNESLALITKEASFCNKQDIEIDIHWRLFDVSGNDDDVPFDQWWADSLPFEFKGRTYRTLSPEDMLLHVIVHGSPNNPQRTLRWVADAVTIIRSFTIDWDRFARLTESSGRAVEVCVAAGYLLEHGFVEDAKAFSGFVSPRSLPARQLNRYYLNAEGRRDVFGPFLVLWRAYWLRGAGDAIPRRAGRFIDYLQHARGLPNRRALAEYVLGWRKRTVKK